MTGTLWALVALAGMAIAAVVGALRYGAHGASVEARIKRAEDEAKTRKRIKDAEDHLGDDPAVLREWLRTRAKRDRAL